MSESNATELIKYLTEDNLKLMYGRLNRRYVVVDSLPSVDSLEPADKNVIYVVKETVGKAVRYWPNVLDNDAWKPFGIDQEDLDRKADKVDAVEGHLVVADKDGNLADADIMPGTFVALAIDPSESIQPHATDLRKIWKAYQSGMPVMLLDNRTNGTGLYASLNAAGYTWPSGDEMAERLTDVDDDNRQYDDTIHGYRIERDGVVKFYEDDAHTVEIIPENGKLYCDDTVPGHDRVYLYNDGFVRALRFVQFSCNELLDDDPAWPSRRANRQVFYRMAEPYGSSSPDGFEVAYGESTADIHDQMVTGARIGKGKLLPVDDGVIVFPKSASVNDGTLTITVGENEPVVFSANDSADRAVDIPVATGEVAGLVRITSDVASDDPGAAITATAVLGELDSYVQKVGDATAGHIAVLTSGGSVSDSGISSTDVESAVGHDHTHGNKSILDGVTAPYTTEEQAKLAGIEARAQVNTIESISIKNAPLDITNKNVDIPIATADSDGLLPHEKFPLIPAEPVAGANRIYSFDDTNGTSWQTIVKEYVGNMILDQHGTPVTDEKGDIMYEEETVPLWLSYKGVEFGARRAYDDHTGTNIHDSIEARTTMAQVTTAIETALAKYGGFVVADSLVDGHPDVADPSERFIYLYRDPQSSAEDPYTEWIYTASGMWDKIGTTSIDVSNFTHKVANATGNLPKLKSDGDLENSGIAASDVATSVQNSHSHSNKAVLDEIPARSGTDSAMLYSADDSSSITWKNWSYVTVSKKTTNSVLIGKTWYPYVQIGNLYWTTENLREPIGTKNIDYRIYDESTVVQRGYLYRKHAILKSNDQEATHTLLEESDAMQALLHDGWHVPTENELNSLCSLKGGYDGGCHFFATDAFDVGGVVYSREPLDTYGYKGYPSGYYSDNKYYSMSNYLFTMSKNAAYNGQLCVWYLDLQPGSWTNLMSQIDMNSFVSVRLCKSAT